MINFTFRLADPQSLEDIKPTIPIQVEAETLALARTKVAEIVGQSYTAGSLISAQEIKELDEE